MMRIRLFICLTVCMSLIGAVPALAQETDASELLKAGDEMVQTTARLRGLEPKVPIQKGIQDRAEIAKFLNERIQAEYDKGAIEKEGKTLEKLGLIPASMDYKEFAIKLLTEQIGGFYDPERKIFFIASWLNLEEQKPIMVHELTHALQDQHFNIGRVMKEDRSTNNDDRTLAHQALLEGDGMVVMLQYILEPLKRHFSQLPDLAFIMRTQISTMQSQYPVFKEAPAFLRETLLFPYGYGASFLQYAWTKEPSWQAINKIYADLPASTEQIMHPEKYFVDRDAPQAVNVDDFTSKLGTGWKVTYKNIFGEYCLGLVLAAHLTDERSRRATSGWDGDQVVLLENEAGKEAVYIATVWDTPVDAERFYASMDEWLRQHYPNTQRIAETEGGFSLIQNGEFSAIKRDGTCVRMVIGLPEADGRKLKVF